VGASQYQTDGDTGLLLLGHRYYDASVGRFLTADPAKAGGNWYAYCDNNPLKGTDPEGLCVGVLPLLPLLPIPVVGEIVVGVIVIAVIVVGAVAIIHAVNDGGPPASATLPDQTGKSQADHEQDLNDNGFNREKDQGSYEKSGHSDGSEVFRNPKDGRIIRQGPKTPGRRGQDRYDQNGDKIPYDPGGPQTHNTGENTQVW